MHNATMFNITPNILCCLEELGTACVSFFDTYYNVQTAKVVSSNNSLIFFKTRQTWRCPAGPGLWLISQQVRRIVKYGASSPYLTAWGFLVSNKNITIPYYYEDHNNINKYSMNRCLTTLKNWPDLYVSDFGS